MTQSSKFGELKPLMDKNQALAEANRCLFCYDAPCTRACPTSIDVPAFIKKISSENLLGSAKTILESNILGASCARVCPTEVLCEGACVMNDLHKDPIQIGKLQRFATEPILLENKPLFQAGEKNGKSVAVVGSGPAGLACAHELVLLGYDVTVFEAEAQAGGLNTYGIADYKLDKEASLQEVQWVQSIGFTIQTNTRVGKDITVETLLAQFDAVFLGVGLGKISPIGIQGENLEGVEDALEFIRDLKELPMEKVSLAGQKVAIIGGGNTAIDAVSQACRLNADKVYMVYRRSEEEVGAYLHERKYALSQGAEFVYLASPTEIVGKQGKVVGLKCVKNKLSEPDASGRRSPKVIEGSDFVLEVSKVYRATGQEKHRAFYSTVGGLTTDKSGKLLVDAEGKTSHPQIWAGGDAANGGKEVVNAVAEGKKAAKNIHQTIGASTNG